ncbi:hypothetical protein I546_1464 [Mycobacterium kansasii 732]|nr:hypothetical protein I546_1464 [Mycobacterium kansasii 732]
MLDHTSFDMAALGGMVRRIVPRGFSRVVHQLHDATSTRGGTSGTMQSITAGANRIDRPAVIIAA